MKKDWFAIGILLILVLLLFGKIIINNEYFSGLDLVNAFYPWKTFLVQSVQAGELPLWNPYTFCGNPFIANFQACIFYPLDMVFFFTSPANAFRILLILHIFLSGLFTYILARYLHLNRTASIFSASVFMFSGFIFVRLSAGHSTMINGYAWIPFIFYLFLKTISEKKSILFLFLSIILAMQFLCGHPQVPYYTLFALGIYLFGYTVFQWQSERKLKPLMYPWITFIAGGIVAGTLAAIQMIPAWELTQLSATRAGGVQYELATVASLSLKYLLLFFAPMLLGSPLDNTFWGGLAGFTETAGYLGIIPLLLSIYAVYRTRRTQMTILFSLIGLIALLFACGKHTPFYWLFYHYFPGFNLFRCPARWLMFVTFAVAILSGIGLHNLIEFAQEKKELKKYLIFLCFIGTIIVLTIGVLNSFKRDIIITLFQNEIASLSEFYGPSVPKEQLAALIPQDAMVNRFQVIINTLWKGFGLFLISSSIFYIFWRSKTATWYLKVLPIVVLLGDLWSFDVWFITTDKAEKFAENYYFNSPEVQFLKSDNTYYRILCLDEVLSWMHTTETGPTAEFRPNRPMLHQIYDTRGYDPVTLRSYVDYINRMQGYPQRSYQGGLLYIPSIEKCDWQMLSRLNVKYILTVNEVNDPNLDLVFYDRLKIYQNKTFIPRAYFVHDQRQENIVRTEINIETYTPNRIEVSVSNNSTGLLVLSELAYPGWQVTVDGKKKAMVVYEEIFRAVELEPGKHQIQFRYQPLSFRLGKLVSLISFLAWSMVLLIKLIVTRYTRKKVCNSVFVLE
ncbi:MAG: YfhO family protein [bacterium]|nr:YfhO family protein [bacterium]